MSAFAKNRTAENSSENSESYFVSMTDLMTGFLFIFIIMLMYFVLQYSSAEEQLSGAKETRSQILEEIRSRLEEHNIIVEVDEENGILRLPEELLFSKGKANIADSKRAAVEHIANAMTSVLPCYAGNSSQKCPFSLGGRLETVLVEGHTDSDSFVSRVGANNQDLNWDLSAFRAINTYRALTELSPKLGGLKNDDEEFVFGVSGYGDRRPLNANLNEREKTKNRRIDLRFIMETPRSLRIVEDVQNVLESTHDQNLSK